MTIQTNYRWFLLIIIVKTTASIVNGGGEECGSPGTVLCGYGSYCLGGYTCSCETGFSSRTTRPAQGGHLTIYHCIETCHLSDNTCPTGTTCEDIGKRTNRCVCGEDYMRSLLGQCINNPTELQTTTAKGTSTEPPRTAIVMNNNTIATSGTSKCEDSPSTELVVSVVFNGILVAILIIIAILFIRQRKCAKNSSNVLEEASREDNRGRVLTDIEVTSTAYQNSVSPTNGIQTSNGNDTAMTHISDYVNTAVYDEMNPPVNSDYINTPQPSQDYVGLRLGQPTEQAVYEHLQNPGNG